jgi:hypothetical protein
VAIVLSLFFYLLDCLNLSNEAADAQVESGAPKA